MDCSEIQSALFDVVDSGGPMSAELKSHLADCEACRLHHQRLAGVRKSLEHDTPPPVALPVGFAARVMSAIEADRDERKPIWRRLMLRAAIAAAAAACVLAGAAWMILDAPPAERRGGDGETASLVMTAPIDLGGPLLADIGQLAGDPITEEMSKFVEDTRRLGSSILTELPVDLLPGVDRNWVESILPAAEADARPSATTNPNQTGRG